MKRPSPDTERVVRTLVLTDLVDSTRLVERVGDAESAALFARVDRATRDLLEEHGGREIDRTDGFLLLFERPLPAIRFTLALHAALRALSDESGHHLVVRAGVHLGEVLLRENSPKDVARGAKPLEVEGLAKPQAARVMSLAAGGQTLLTRTAFDVARRAAVGEAGAAGLKWQSHGDYVLKGVTEPVEICEVADPTDTFLAAPQDTQKARRARPERARRWLVPAAVGALLLGAVAGAVAWTARDTGPRYATVSHVPMVASDAVTQSAYVSSVGALLRDDFREARSLIEGPATGSRPGAPIAVLYAVACIGSGEPFPREVLDEALAAPAVDGDLDRWLLEFMERWQVEGWSRKKLAEEIHGHVEAHPDHLLGQVVAGLFDLRERVETHAKVHAEALATTDPPPALRYSLAVTSMQLSGRIPELGALLEEGRRYHPKNPSLAISGAWFELIAGNPAAAIAPLQQIIVDRPDDTNARGTLARAYLRTGDWDGARRELDLVTSDLVPPAERVSTLLSASEAAYTAGRAEWGARLGDESLEQARKAHNPELLVNTWFQVFLGSYITRGEDIDAFEAMNEAMGDELEGLDMEPALRHRTELERLDLKTVLAVRAGDLERAEALSARHVKEIGGATFGGVHVMKGLRAPDQEIAEIRDHGVCRDALFVGRFWALAGMDAPARELLVQGLTEDCPTLDTPLLRPLAYGTLAKLSFEAGDRETALENVARFRALWPDTDLPIGDDVALVERGLSGP